MDFYTLECKKHSKAIITLELLGRTHMSNETKKKTILTTL